MARINDINIVDGRIVFSNFAGRPTTFKPEGGVRTVTFEMPEDIVPDLQKDGWKIRQWIPASERDNPDARPVYLLEAKISYRKRDGSLKDPKIFLVTKNGLIHVDEEMCDELDRAEIVNVEGVLGPSYWEYAGKSGITAYVNCLYITIKENPIEAKYKEMYKSDSVITKDELDSLPFPMDEL